MALTGNETLFVLGQTPQGKPAAGTFPTTTGAIAALASVEYSGNTVTDITTVGAGTLTAAALAGGVINRSGPTVAYTDTTATAAQLYSQTGSDVNVTFYTVIKNTVPFTETLAGGTGITFSGQTLIPANSVGTYLVTFTNATAAVFRHVQTVPLTTGPLEVITVLSTVGAGTITAAGIAGSVTSRTGSQSATPFTDTTDTANNIIAAVPNARIGQSFYYTYQNTTNATATLAGGTGVTVSGITSVPAGRSATYLVTYTAANTVTMVGFNSGGATSASSQSVILAGSTSGTTTVVASATAGSTTITLPALTDTAVTLTSVGSVQTVRCTATISATSGTTGTTLTNVTGLTVPVLAAGVYAFRAYIAGVSTANSGVKLAIAQSGSTTSVSYTGRQFNGTTLNANTTTTTMGNAVAAGTAVYTDATIEGTTVVNAAGNLTVQFAQNASHADTTSVFINSYFTVMRIA